jgi:hypothetical protein
MQNGKKKSARPWIGNYKLPLRRLSRKKYKKEGSYEKDERVFKES